ncbi:MAG: fumarylacetoacetate hydrolase family protein [Acidimicrobiia bacterium]|nr:fumarylacetoacetate hydrolase family protein [Acidimicrobiia bacterium]
MRFLSFHAAGHASYGVVRDGGILDLGARLGDRHPTLRSYLEAAAHGIEPPHGAGHAIDFRLEDVRYLPVCEPRKILCVGHNYADHRAEMGRPPLAHPTIFTRFPDTLVGHQAPIVRPRVSTALDFEGELAVVIGKEARHVPRERALEYVAGYACFNDASVRDWQRHTSQFTPGKNFPGTGPLGPDLVTPDEVGPLGSQRIQTRLNGTVVQAATLDQMIFTVADLVAYVSAFTRLTTGDVIASGTPGGVGAMREPPLWMQPGDLVEVEIDGVGCLRNPIADEPA